MLYTWDVFMMYGSLIVSMVLMFMNGNMSDNRLVISSIYSFSSVRLSLFLLTNLRFMEKHKPLVSALSNGPWNRGRIYLICSSWISFHLWFSSGSLSSSRYLLISAYICSSNFLVGAIRDGYVFLLFEFPMFISSSLYGQIETATLIAIGIFGRWLVRSVLIYAWFSRSLNLG